MHFFQYRMGLVYLFISGLLVLSCVNPNSISNKKKDTIYFLSNREAPKREFDIFSMDMNGNNPMNLTRQIRGIRAFSKPVVSPDGQTILFVTLLDTKRTLKALNLNDSTVVSLTNILLDAPKPQYSPDGKTIVFQDIENKKSQIFKMHADGSNRVNLSSNDYEDSNAKFSKDGQLLCYQTKRGGKSSIAIMNPDGSKQYVLTDEKGDDVNPSFSNDRKNILFSSNRNGAEDIFLVHIADLKLEVLYDNKSNDIEPQFFPDNKHILFKSDFRGKNKHDLVRLNLKTKYAELISQSDYSMHQNAVISSDGNIILLDANNFMNSEILKINVKKQSVKALTTHPKWDIMPVF